MDLFTPIVPKASWHPYFAYWMHDPWIKAGLNDWAEGFVDRDGKFTKEFQTTVNSCFWELYLNAVLRDRGCSVTFEYPAPDFVVIAPAPFTIEATIASHAQGQLPEFHPLSLELIPDDLNELNREAILRLSNSLRSKYEKYKAHYATLPHVHQKPFVIAVAPFDRPAFHLACQRAIEAVLFNYYVDEEKYISEGDYESSIPHHVLLSVRKENGADVELGLFLNDSMSEVSAVIFSTCASTGKVYALSDDPNPNLYFQAVRLNPHSSKPHVVKARKVDYHETLLDGLRIYHNPYAIWPLDPTVFRSREVFQAYYCHEKGEWVYEQPEGQLLSRMVVGAL